MHICQKTIATIHSHGNIRAEVGVVSGGSLRPWGFSGLAVGPVGVPPAGFLSNHVELHGFQLLAISQRHEVHARCHADQTVWL